MKSSTFKNSLVACALLCATTLQLPLAARAQSGAGGGSPASASPQGQPAGGSVSINNQAGRVQIRLERGSKVSVSNRYGRITITGWDKETVEATATNTKGEAQAVQVDLTADPQARSTLSLAVAGRRGATPGGLFYPGAVLAPGAILSQADLAELSKTAATAAASAAILKDMESRTEKQIEKAMQDALKQKDKAREEERDKARDRARERSRSETPEGGVVIVQPEPGEAVATPSVTVAPPKVTVRPPAAVAQTAPPAQPAAKGGAGPTPRPAPRPGAATVWGAQGVARGEEITLDVKVPRYAELETLNLSGGELNVSNLDGPVTVESRGGNVNASRLGALTVRTRGGDVVVDGVEGMVYVVANTGDITVRNAGSEVRATTTNGDISVSCARGRVDVNTAFGKIALANIGGDVDAVTTDSDINYTGAITEGGRYRLKSMEGRVIMSIPENSPGFTATLMSYNREAISDFAARQTTPNPATQAARRREVAHGNGRSVILLDSFGQIVNLTKLAPAANNNTTCR